MKTWKRIKRAIRNWLDCRMKRCDYYRHYLAYGPAELTHDGFHAACWHCEEAQKRLQDWFDSHPEGVPPSHLENTCQIWERRVRA